VKKLLFIFFAAATLHSQAQSTPLPEQDADNYSSAICYGVNTNTNSGLLGGIVIKKVNKLPNPLFGRSQFKYLALEIINVKHPKEVPITVSGGRYTPGKQNYLWVLRPEYGRELILSSRNADEGISINAIMAIGPSLGIVKPYYIQYKVRSGAPIKEQYDPIKHTNPEAIQGAGSILDGIGKSKIAIGGHLKAALNFELSAFKNTTTGIEIGFLVESFTNKIPIMGVFQQGTDTNRSTFTSAYITLFFGNRE
jgi:hypothetical protein